MFTGIIQTLGTVISTKSHDHGMRLVIETTLAPKHLQLGASVMCNGACMTVVEYDPSLKQFSFEVSPESLSKTTLSQWNNGTHINLEPSLCVGDPLGGHIVTGHVDEVATVSAIKQLGDYYDLAIKVSDALLPFIAIKGSLAIDGCSLTVANIEANQIHFAIIPHTWSHTVMHTYQIGSLINVEIDILARYVARALSI